MITDWENQLILGRFRVDVRLPGTGESYRAWDNLTKQVVSLHLLIESDDALRRPYDASIRELERVAHPGILPYLGLFELSGQRFWVESYLEGPTLRLVLDAAQGAPLPLGEVLTYMKSLSAALDGLHELGLVHAHLRSESVRIGRDGRIYLTELYGAQRLSDDLAKATDVAALAKLLYEMLAGVLPNQRPWPDLRTLNPDVPEFLARTLPRALGENAESRIVSPTEFFLMACLACHIEADKLPERITTGAASPSMAIVSGWTYLGAMPPPPVTPKAIDRDRNREPSALSWWLMAGAIVGVGLMVGYFFAGQTLTPAQVLPTVAASTLVVVDVPTVESVVAFPTDTVVPTVNAPDGLGGRLVFTCTRTDMLELELMQLCMSKPNGEGGVVRLIAEASHFFYPSFSPDGKTIVFASNRGGGNFNLYTRPVLGDDLTLTQLTNGIGDVASASFSPDGKTIAFSNEAEGKPSLWTVGADGQNLVKLYEGVGNIASPVWAPNGKSIAFVMSSDEAPEAYEAYIYDTETKNIAPITKGHLNFTGGSVDWSPDGRFLLLFAGPTGAHDIYQLELVSGAIVKLTNGGNNFAASYSPDGQWIVFNHISSPSVDSAPVADVTPSGTPDGTPTVPVSSADETANIYIMRADGTDIRRVTSDTDPDWQPRWGR